jgi:XTP/dITP diphosphohydrolase
VFVPIGHDGRSFAEMSPEEKHAISHRGRALRTLADGVRAMIAGTTGAGGGPGTEQD